MTHDESPHETAARIFEIGLRSGAPVRDVRGGDFDRAFHIPCTPETVAGLVEALPRIGLAILYGVDTAGNHPAPAGTTARATGRILWSLPAGFRDTHVADVVNCFTTERRATVVRWDSRATRPGDCPAADELLQMIRTHKKLIPDDYEN